MSKHFIGHRPHSSEIVSLLTEAALVQHKFVGYKANSTTTAAVAEGRNFVGNVRQAVTTNGVTTDHHFPGLSERLFTMPVKVGDHVDVQRWAEFECEGTDFLQLDSAEDGPVTTATAQFTKLALVGGILRVAQPGDVATHELLAANLTIQDTTITTGTITNARCLIRELPSAETIPAA